MSKRAPVNWIWIERLIRAGLNNREIARQYGEAFGESEDFAVSVTEGAIRKRKKDRNIHADLSGRIAERLQDKLVREEVRGRVPGEVRTDEQIIEEAAEARAGVVRLRRKNVASIQPLIDDCIRRLNTDNQLGILERIKALEILIRAIHRTAETEWLVWSLSRPENDPDDDKENRIRVILNCAGSNHQDQGGLE